PVGLGLVKIGQPVDDLEKVYVGAKIEKESRYWSLKDYHSVFISHGNLLRSAGAVSAEFLRDFSLVCSVQREGYFFTRALVPAMRVRSSSPPLLVAPLVVNLIGHGTPHSVPLTSRVLTSSAVSQVLLCVRGPATRPVKYRPHCSSASRRSFR